MLIKYFDKPFIFYDKYMFLTFISIDGEIFYMKLRNYFDQQTNSGNDLVY